MSCIGCTERKVGCHARCEDYAEFMRINNKRKDTIRQNKTEYLQGINYDKEKHRRLIRERGL